MMRKIFSVILLHILLYILLLSTPVFAASSVSFIWDSNSSRDNVKFYTLYYTTTTGLEKSKVIDSFVVDEDNKIKYILTPLEDGEYCFQLTVSNDNGESPRTVPPICSSIGLVDFGKIELSIVVDTNIRVGREVIIMFKDFILGDVDSKDPEDPFRPLRVTPALF